MMEMLFIRPLEQHSLDTISATVSRLLDVDLTEERHSDNAPGGRYRRGKALALEIVLQEGDTLEFADYSFELILRPQFICAGEPRALAGLADLVAKCLARNKLKIARPTDPVRAGSARVEY